MTLPESQDQNTPVEEHDDDQSQAPEQSEILEVVERLKTSNQNDSGEIISTLRNENTELQFSVLEFIEQNPSQYSLEAAIVKSIYDMLLDYETNRYNNEEVFDQETYDRNENYEVSPFQENSNYQSTGNIETSLNPGELGETRDTASSLNYFDLKRKAVNKQRFAIPEFADIKFTNGEVDKDFIDATIANTPISYQDLMNLKNVPSFRNQDYFNNYALPTALLTIRVLKERGLEANYFKVIFSMCLSTMNTESGCGSNIITNNRNSSATGLGQFLLRTAIATFKKLPERERQQYPELASANAEQIKPLIRARLLGSATFNVRLTVSFVMELFNKIKSKPGTNTSNVASRMYMAYNSGLSNVDFFLEFYEKFPPLAKGITPEAAAFLKANRHRVKGRALTRSAIVKKRLPLGRRAPWFHTQGRFNQIFRDALGVETSEQII